jgi:metal transporter CNNM
MTYIIVIILIACSALFSGLTLGLLGLNLYELKRKADLGDKRAQVVYPIRQKGNLLLTTLLLGNVIVNTILAVFLGSIASGLVATLTATGLIFLFGEIIPQAFISRYALDFGAQTAPLVKILLFVLYPVAGPIAWVLDKLLGNELPTIYSKNELAALIAEHEDSPDSKVDADEERILHGALTFSDRTVSDVMTPRTVVRLLEKDEELTTDLLKEIRESSHSRLPVYEHVPEQILGFVHIRNLVGVTTGTAHQFMEPMHSVQEKMPLDAALNAFITKKQHLFAVFDEFGSFSGVISLEDIIEEILQVEIMDEDDRVADLRALAEWRAKEKGNK